MKALAHTRLLFAGDAARLTTAPNFTHFAIAQALL